MNKGVIIKILLVLIILVLVLIGLKPVFLEEKVTNEDGITEIKLGVIPKINTDKAYLYNNNIYIQDGGIYNITGILYNGVIYIDTNEEVTLNLNGVTLVNEVNSVIDNRKSSKLIINLGAESNNILSDGINSNSAIKSVGDVTIKGNGNMLIYGNNGNGITVSDGILEIADVTLYVMARNTAFNASEELIINSGIILGLGSDKMQPPSDSSKQNTLLFNFATIYGENTPFSLKNVNGDVIVNFLALRDFKTLTLSMPELKAGRYQLYQNTGCDSLVNNGIYDDCDPLTNDMIKIGITDTYIVNNTWNWYGNMDIMINYFPEIKT